MENGCDVIVFSNSQQGPCCTILNILQSLQAFLRDPDEKCVAVIQSGGDKGVDQFFSICQCWTEFCNISEMVERCLAEVFDKGFDAELWVKSYTKIGNSCGEGNVMTRDSFS